MTTAGSRVLVAVLVGLVVGAISVAAQQQGMMMRPDRGMVMSKYGYDETVTRVKQAIESQQLMVLFTADHQQMLRMVQVEAPPMATIEFFHPRYGKRIFEGNREASPEIPLRILVMQGDKGAMVSWVKPSTTIGKYKGLESLGSELDSTLQQIAASVTK